MREDIEDINNNRMRGISNDNFGIFFRWKKRIYTEFFYIAKRGYISGHKGYEIYIGSLYINLIYRF